MGKTTIIEIMERILILIQWEDIGREIVRIQNIEDKDFMIMIRITVMNDNYCCDGVVNYKNKNGGNNDNNSNGDVITGQKTKKEDMI